MRKYAILAAVAIGWAAGMFGAYKVFPQNQHASSRDATLRGVPTRLVACAVDSSTGSPVCLGLSGGNCWVYTFKGHVKGLASGALAPHPLARIATKFCGL